MPVARLVRSGTKRKLDSGLSPHGTGCTTRGRVDVRADVVPQVGAQHVVERQEDRQLRDHRETGRERVDLVLPVELHRLLLESLRVVLVLRLQHLHLRRELLQPDHRLRRLVGDRQQDRPHQQRQEHDRPSPSEPDRVVEEPEDRLEEVDQRLQDVREDGRHGVGIVAGH